MMIMIGVLHAIQGVVALFNDEFYVVGEEWVFTVDITAWGWMQLLLGALVAAAGFFVLNGAVWARTVGVIVACLSIIATFAWLPYYPIWAILIISIGVLVVWALTVHGGDITKRAQAGIYE